MDNQVFREPLINSTVTANCCVMRCSEYSHMSEYAAFPALLFLALHPPQRITQSLLSILAYFLVIHFISEFVLTGSEL